MLQQISGYFIMSCAGVMYHPYSTQMCHGKRESTNKQVFQRKKLLRHLSELSSAHSTSEESDQERMSVSPVLSPDHKQHSGPAQQRPGEETSEIFASKLQAMIRPSSRQHRILRDQSKSPKIPTPVDLSQNNLGQNGKHMHQFSPKHIESATSLSILPPLPPQQTKHVEVSSSTTGYVSSAGRMKKQRHPTAHRVSPRCVMFSYFDGRSSDEVDQHFTRALSSKSPRQEITSRLCDRKFPASFWDSDYQFSSASINKSTHEETISPIYSFNSVTPFSPFLPHPSHASGFGAPASRRAYSPHFVSKFDLYPPVSKFSALQDIQQTVNAVTAAAVASRGVSDPWRPFAGHSSSLPGQTFYSRQAMRAAMAASSGVQDLYGLSAAAVAAAATNQSFDQHFNPLLLQQASVMKGNSFATSLACGESASKGLWPLARYSDLRF